MNNATHSDIELVKQFRQGSADAFEKIYTIYFKQILFFARRLLGNNEDAEEIAQETFTKLWAIHQNFESISNIKAFLYITCRNTSLNFIKKSQYDRNKQKELVYFLPKNDSELMEIEIYEAAIITRLQQEIEKLPPRTRQIMTLFYFQRLKYNEIALKLGISYHTVKNLLISGVKTLRVRFLDSKEIMVLLILFCSLFFDTTGLH